MKINRFATAIILVFMITCGFISANAQTATQPNDRATIDALVTKTLPIYSMGSLKSQTEADLKDQMSEMIGDMRTGLSTKLQSMSHLTPADRENVMTNFGPFANEFIEHCQFIITRGLDPERWIRNSLDHRFSNDFTPAQRSELRTYLDGKHGTLLVNMLKEEVEAQTDGRESMIEEMISESEAVELQGFFESTLGKKFLGLFDEQFNTLINKNIDEWSKSMLADIESEMSKGKLGEMFKKFLADNKLTPPKE